MTIGPDEQWWTDAASIMDIDQGIATLAAILEHADELVEQGHITQALRVYHRARPVLRRIIDLDPPGELVPGVIQLGESILVGLRRTRELGDA